MKSARFLPRESEKLQEETLFRWGRAPKSAVDMELPLLGKSFRQATIVTNDKLLLDAINFHLRNLKPFKQVNGQTPAEWLTLLADNCTEQKQQDWLRKIAEECWKSEMQYAAKHGGFDRILEAWQRLRTTAKQVPRVVPVTPPPSVGPPTDAPGQQGILASVAKLSERGSQTELYDQLTESLRKVQMGLVEGRGLLAREIIEQTLPKLMDVGVYCLADLLARGGIEIERGHNLIEKLIPLEALIEEDRSALDSLGLWEGTIQILLADLLKAKEALEVVQLQEAEFARIRSSLLWLTMKCLGQDVAEHKLSSEDLPLIIDILTEVRTRSFEVAIAGIEAILTNTPPVSGNERNETEKLLANIYLHELQQLKPNVDIVAPAITIIPKVILMQIASIRSR